MLKIMTNTLTYVTIADGTVKIKNTTKKNYSTFGRKNYPKKKLMKSGRKNIKNQLTVITQKVSVKRLIVKEERKNNI
jgi:hypothetical protein